MEPNNKFTTTHLRKAIIDENLKEVKKILYSGVRVTPAEYSEPDLQLSLSPLRFYSLESEDTDNKIEILKTLLDAGASLTVFCHESEQIMIHRLLSGGKRRTIETVLQYKNDFSEKFVDGNTLLHFLAANKDPCISYVLRGRKLDVNLKNDLNQTPFLCSILYGNFKTVEYLYENNAKIDSNTNYLKLMWRLFKDQQNRQKNENRVQIMEFLLMHGAKLWLPEFGYYSYFDFDFIQPIFAHMALRYSLDEQCIDSFILSEIDSSMQFKKYFESFQKVIDELRSSTIYKSVTLYDLLNESLENISVYICEYEFNRNFHNQTNKIRYSYTSYYVKMMSDKIEKAIDMAENKEKCILIISKIIGFHWDAYPHILFKIIKLLDYVDLRNLCLADDINY